MTTTNGRDAGLADRPREPSRLAYKDVTFVESREARPLRILAEYLEPLRHFEREGVHDTVVFFGSARIASDGPLARYYVDARELARRLTAWARSIDGGRRRFVVCSGGGPGIMEAANRGAADAGGATIGLNIGLPHEQRPNAFITPELDFEFRYFFMRKFWFAYLSRALVVFPGGFGTLDELTEILTLSQTGKLSRAIPILLYGSSFWNDVLNFEALARHGVIAREDLQLFKVVDSVEQAFEALTEALAPFIEVGRAERSPAIACSCHSGTGPSHAAAACCTGEHPAKEKP